MTLRTEMNNDRRSVTIRIPMAFRKRGGRRLVIVPDNQSLAPRRARVDSTLVKALARAHRWKGMLESGKFASVIELAHAEKINDSYLCRILRLTLVAPELVETVLDGRQPAMLQLDDPLAPLPSLWSDQSLLPKKSIHPKCR